MSKVLAYIKEHKWFLLCFLIGLILFAIQISQVTLYADDFELKITSDTEGLFGVFNEIHRVYFNWGGGPTPGIAVFFLLGNLLPWQIFSVALFVVLLLMILKMVKYRVQMTDKEDALFTLLFYFFWFFISIYVSRESLYWLDGSLAYFLPVFLMIAYFYYSYRIMIKNKESKLDYFLLPILAFFAGWNSPQAGAISIVMVGGLLLFQVFVNKQKWNKKVLFSLFFCIIGFAILYFAPGNAVRQATFTEYVSLSFVERIFYRLKDLVPLCIDHLKYPGVMLPWFVFALVNVIIISSVKNIEKIKEKRIMYVCLVIAISFLIGRFLLLLPELPSNLSKVIQYFYVYDLSYKLSLLQLAARMLSYGYFIAFLLSVIYITYRLSLIKKDAIPIILVLSTFLSQIVMIFAPYSPIRSTLITIVLIIITILYMIYNYAKDRSSILLILALLLLFYNIYYAIFIIALYVGYLLCNTNRSLKNLYFYGLILLVVLPSFINGIITFKQYYDNKAVYDKNIMQIEKYKENGQRGNLVLYKVAAGKELYGWDFIYSDITWIRDSILVYFHLDPDTTVIVVDSE